MEYAVNILDKLLGRLEQFLTDITQSDYVYAVICTHHRYNTL
jgi:hypothetical protein